MTRSALRSPRRGAALVLLAALLALSAAPSAQDGLDPLAGALQRAGDNRPEIERALRDVPPDQAAGLRWLVERMPEADLRALDAEYLLENCDEAYAAWRTAPWGAQVPEALFLDAVLPYASVSEPRERWRADFRGRFTPLVAEAASISEAAAILNAEVFPLVGVRYSTGRERADQGPLESIESGLASCTGLSVLLIDACRAVGIPARFVGTPLWSDGSGNHSWVEVWDGGWRFTGAAEPTGRELDRAWFTGRAAKATREDPRNAIYAVTWRQSPIHFPQVWSPEDTSVRAVDVTDRYAGGSDPVRAGFAAVRFRVLDPERGARVALPIAVVPAEGGEPVFEGTSRDERFDANDHVTAELPLGERFVAEVGADGRRVAVPFEVADEEQLVEVELPPAGRLSSSAAVGALRADLEGPSGTSSDPPGLAGLAAEPFATVPLSEADADAAADLLRAAHAARIRAERTAELDARELELDGLRMPFWLTEIGEAPAGGRSLWISMHGGGGAPPEVNDRQWENQKRLYEPVEGLYLAPRAPTDTWNLWHQGHVDRFFDRLIEDLVVLRGVDPDRVYLMGYSAGGDGVFQLAPRMADRFAAAAMMAGHPNETRPDGLRNLPFSLQVGGEDAAYDRNAVARRWEEWLAELADADPGGYPHHVVIHEGKGHWMDGEDAAVLPWMAEQERDLRPERVVWLQDDVVHERFYWLAVEDPEPRRRVVVEREGQTVRVAEADGPLELSIRVDDEMFDLDEELLVLHGDRELFRGRVPRTIATMARTLAERGDPRGVFRGEIVVDVAGD